GQESIAVGLISPLRALAHWERSAVVHAGSRFRYADETAARPVSHPAKDPKDMALHPTDRRCTVSQNQVSRCVDAERVGKVRLTAVIKFQERHCRQPT